MAPSTLHPLPGSGPQLGGTARLSSRTHLLQHGLSPHMDAALLVTPPPPPPPPSAPTSAPAQPAMPANLSVAQRRMREMMARRQAAKTGAAAAPAGPAGPAATAGPNAEPTRGAPLKLELWRLVAECTKIWEVDCPRPSIFGPANEAEREDSTVLSIVWSPDSQRVGIHLLLTRTSASNTRQATALVLLSVQTGTVVRSIRISASSSPATNVLNTPPPPMIWVHSLPYSSSTSSNLSDPASTTSPLHTLRNLAPLPSYSTLRSYAPATDDQGPSRLPHHMRLHQLMAGGHTPTTTEPQTELDSSTPPSEAANQWSKVPLPTDPLTTAGHHAPPASHSLATIPTLPISAARWGVVDHEFPPPGTGEPMEVVALGEQGTERDWNHVRNDVLLVPFQNQINILAQGTAFLGSISTKNDVHVLDALWSSPSDPLLTLTRSSATQVQANVYPALLSSSKLDGKKEMATYVTLSTTASHLLSYALDVLHTMHRAWGLTFLPAIKEWQSKVEEIQTKYSVNWKLELIAAAAGGRMGDGLSHILLSEINENALNRLQDATYSSLRYLRRAAATALAPCAERLLLILTTLRAHGILSSPGLQPRNELGLQSSEPERLVQDLLRLSMAVETECEKELLAAGEFYLWWRGERDLQESENLEGYPVGHDVLTVTEYIMRGFTNPLLSRLLSGSDVLLPPCNPTNPRSEQEQDQAQKLASQRDAEELDRILDATESILECPPGQAGDTIVVSPSIPTYEQVEQLFQSSFSVPGVGDTNQSSVGELPPLDVRGSLWALTAHTTHLVSTALVSYLPTLDLNPHTTTLPHPVSTTLVTVPQPMVPRNVTSFAPGPDTGNTTASSRADGVQVVQLGSNQGIFIWHGPNPELGNQHVLQLVRFRLGDDGLDAHTSVTIDLVLHPTTDQPCPVALTQVDVVPSPARPNPTTSTPLGSDSTDSDSSDGTLVLLLQTQPIGAGNDRIVHVPLSSIWDRSTCLSKKTDGVTAVSQPRNRDRWRFPPADAQRTGAHHGYGGNASISLNLLQVPRTEAEWPVVDAGCTSGRLSVVLCPSSSKSAEDDDAGQGKSQTTAATAPGQEACARLVFWDWTPTTTPSWTS